MQMPGIKKKSSKRVLIITDTPSETKKPQMIYCYPEVRVLNLYAAEFGKNAVSRKFWREDVPANDFTAHGK